MPAQIIFGPVKDKIPQERIPLQIHSIASTDVVGKYAFLKIKHRYKHQVCRVNRLKMLLEDRVGHVIDFFALGKVADDLQDSEKGDMLLCLEFELEECPGHCQRPYQIIADDTGTRKSSIWISKPLSRPASSFTTHDTDTPHVQVGKISDSKDEKNQHQKYNYRPLSEVKINTVVDVYGVVKFAKPPIKGKGSDYSCVIGITDPSLFKGDEKLTCIFFNREPDNLPKVDEGDVLRLHRLKIQTYQGGKQGQNGPGFQWLAFHKSIDSRTSSSASYTFEDEDKRQANNLLNWWSKLCQNGMNSVESPMTNVNPLSKIKPRDYFDLVCQVVRVCELEPDVCRLIRVWDGTKSQMQLKEISEGELNQSLREDCSIVNASMGLCVDIFVFDNHAQESSHVKPGDFLLLTNVHSSVVSGLVELTIHGGGHRYNRGIKILPLDSMPAQILKLKLSEISHNSNNSSLKATASVPSGQVPSSNLSRNGTSDPAAERGTEVLSRIDGATQGFHLSNDDSTKDHSSMIEEYSTDGASPIRMNVNSAHEIDKLRGRKDVVSKNKSLRREMLLQGSSTKDFDHNSTPDKFVRHSKDKDVSLSDLNTTDDLGDADKSDGSHEGSSQSIWLSLYNDRDNKQEDSENACLSDLEQGASATEESSPVSRKRKANSLNKNTTHTSNVYHARNTARDGLSSQASLSDQENMLHKDLSEDCGSSQESFVTVENEIDFSPSRINQEGTMKDREAPINFSAENQRQTEKRTGEKLSSVDDKRLKLSSERNERGNTCGFSENISQNHLDLIDSEMFFFDIEQCFQTNQIKHGADNSIEIGSQETESPVEKYSESQNGPKLRSRKYTKTVLTNSSANESFTSPETQFPHSSKDLEMSERGQVYQESQDLIQAGKEDSQVSSSTDSLKVSSQPRCMLKTASVILSHPNMPVNTLQEVLDQKPPYKFHILVRVEKVEPRPSVPQDIVHFLCPQCRFFSRMEFDKNDSDVIHDESIKCPRCVEPPCALRAVSVLALQLADQQNSITAFVWDKNADLFFGGMTPYQLLNDNSCFRQVQEWLSYLCPLGSSLESRPLLECCICSYYVDGDVKMQIFDTSLVQIT
ncbi:hypothetical protein EGW08_003271 [Elysia chlorotica]|uniref:Protection of telomeres protein 1 n=1 Tax=Elysia chlorotica TaxID=188477 RepID=A0A3S1AD88_ELYCH|nr:hypothetical protein EGW08_003271 [Elysia chlorotica]